MTFNVDNWTVLLTQAAKLGPQILEGVKALAKKFLSPVDNAAVLAKWEDNVRRSGANAGLPPEA